MVLYIDYIHPFTHTLKKAMAEETMQGTNLLTGSNEGFRVLLKDSSTLILVEPEIELGTLREPSMFKDSFLTTAAPLLKCSFFLSFHSAVIHGSIL